jgi:DNA-binding IscR family transcriptional regulator
MPDCSIRSVWRTIQRAIDSVLGTLTLKDLLRGEEEMNLWADSRGRLLPTHRPHA